MQQTLEIIWSSFKMAMQELWKNKLRTFLSLFGITIGIFCIISVLATVNSLQQNITNEIKANGSNTIFLDKWNYSAGDGFENDDWKYANRPVPRYAEVNEIKERTPTAKYVAFKIQSSGEVEYAGYAINNVNFYGISEDFNKIQTLEVLEGRYMNQVEFDQGANNIVLGWEIADKLFGSSQAAIGKKISFLNSKAFIVGVLKKQGKQMFGGWDFDYSAILNYQYGRTVMSELYADPLILIKGDDKTPIPTLKNDLLGSVRSIRKLSPTQEDNFTLNDINELTDKLGAAFLSLNIGGWAIAILSLVVGMFGVANIMFVTVRERRAQIGLKKAIGAKSHIILTEFLLESAFLCIVGGLIGLGLVFVLTKVLTNILHFPVFISVGYMLFAIIVCIIVGILAGFIPASQASRLDPVVAIRG